MKNFIKNGKIFVLLFLLLSPMFVNAEETTYIAQIGDNKYETWADVLDNVKENDKIILLSDVSEITFNAGMKVVLNLNNYTVYDVENNGTLTIKGPGVIENRIGKNGVNNNLNSVLIIDNVTFESIATSTSLFVNHGTATIKNSTFDDENDTNYTLLFNNDGNLVLESGNYNAYYLFENSGTLTINNGDYKSTGGSNNSGILVINGGSFNHNGSYNMIDNEGGTITFNSGTFTSTTATSIAHNYKSNSTITVNGGTFNANGNSAVFVNSINAINSAININGGTINHTGDYSVIQDACMSDECNNIINIQGGTITSKQDGFSLYHNTKLIIGTNDGDVKKDNLMIDISNDNFLGGFDAIIEFYDGTIKLNGEITNDNFTSLVIPEGYRVQYDKNDDGSYTAYLVKNSTGDVSTTPDTNTSQPTTSTPKEETVKNPDTGLFNNYGVVIGVIVVLGTVGYLGIRKRSKFPRV